MDEITAINKGLLEKKYRVTHHSSKDKAEKLLIAEAYTNLVNHALSAFMSKRYGWKCSFHLKSPKFNRPRLLFKIYDSIYELCKEIYINQQNIKCKIPWDDGFVWFGRCCRDLFIIEILDTYNRPAELNKHAIIRLWRLRIQDLKKLEFSESTYFSEYHSECVGLLNLLKAACQFAEYSTTFKTRYWTPFINCLTKYVDEMEKGTLCVIEVDTNENRIYLTSRQGRGGNTQRTEYRRT